jgi:hypothetical protein
MPKLSAYYGAPDLHNFILRLCPLRPCLANGIYVLYFMDTVRVREECDAKGASLEGDRILDETEPAVVSSC